MAPVPGPGLGSRVGHGERRGAARYRNSTRARTVGGRRCPRSGTSTSRMPGGAAPGVGRHEGDRVALPRGLGQPAAGAADPADLAGEPDLADRDHAGGQRRGPWRAEAIASASARSAGRLGDPHAADRGGEDVGVGELDPAAALDHGVDHRHPLRVQAAHRPPRGAAAAGGRDQRLHLGQQRPAALQGDRDAAAGHRRRRGGRRTAPTGRAPRPRRRRRSRSSRSRRPGRSGS